MRRLSDEVCRKVLYRSASQVHCVLFGDYPVVPTDDPKHSKSPLVHRGFFTGDGETASVSFGADHGFNGDERHPKEEIIKLDIGFHGLGVGRG